MKLKKLTVLSIAMLAASAFQMQAKSAALASAPNSTNDSGMQLVQTSCGKWVWILPESAFSEPAQYEEYLSSEHYRLCGDRNIPETWPRPTPTTQPDDD